MVINMVLKKNYNVLKCFGFQDLSEVLNVTIQFMVKVNNVYEEEKAYVASRSQEGWQAKYIGEDITEVCKSDSEICEKLAKEIGKAIERKNSEEDMYLRINVLDLEARNLAFEFLKN